MDGFCCIQPFMKIDEDLLSSIKSLPFEYDAPDEFTEHKRYCINKNNLQHPKFIENIALYICNILNIMSNSKLFVFDESLLNSILINRYEKGESCGWHQDFDDEQWCSSDKNHAVRIVLPIGPSKIFQIRDIETKTIKDILMQSGDVVIISESFDKLYEHGMPIPNDNEIRYTFMMTFEIRKEYIPSIFSILKFSIK